MRLCLPRLRLRRNLEHFRSNAAPQGLLWVCSRSCLDWLSHGEGSLGTPRQCFEQSLQPLPLAKKPSKCEVLVFGAANGRDILGAVLFSRRLSSCLLLLLHFFDLSSFPLPSCLSFGGEMRFPFPLPCACPGAKIQETHGSVDHLPRGFENHKSLLLLKQGGQIYSAPNPPQHPPNLSTKIFWHKCLRGCFQTVCKAVAKPTGRPVQRHELFQH